MDAVITGENIAYVYLFTGYYDDDEDVIVVADRDYIEADGTKVIVVRRLFFPSYPYSVCLYPLPGAFKVHP